MPERNILDMLANLAHWTAWPSHLGPPSGSESKLTDPVQRSLCYCGSAPRPPAPAGLLHAVESQLHMAEHTLGAAPKERRHGGAIVGDVTSLPMWKSSVSPQADHPKWTVPKGLTTLFL